MTGDDATKMRHIGRSMPRREDRRLLVGEGRFVDDALSAGALHACFVRSPHPHARIVAIDSAAARTAPGVVAIATASDIAGLTMPLRMAPPIDGLEPTEVATLPGDKVRFQGDLVACVVATDRYLAEDACELVEVEYQPLEAVTDIDRALAADAPRVDETLASNLVSRQSFASGDVRGAFSRAHKIVESRFYQGRQTHVPIETRGCLARWDKGREHLTLHIGSQVPHPLRTQLAARLMLDESQVTVVSEDVGGGFGQKIALYREELIVAAMALTLRRPVHWREDRMENLMAAAHAREQTVTTEAAVNEDGRFLALRMAITEDFGAYCFYPANYMARVVAMILTGPYRIDNYAYEVRAVLSNKCGSGPMRAPMSITSWVMEGTIDAVARALEIDPVAVRRRNILNAADLPHRMPTGEVLADVTPRETLEQALATIGYDAVRQRQARDRANGVWRGIGICNVVESTTYGSAFYKAAGIAGSGHETAWIRVEPSGSVVAATGLAPTGQGYETTFAQAVAEGIGVLPEAVRIDLGNTDVAPYGMGSRGARGGTAGGSVLFLAARQIREKVLTIAAAVLSLNSPDELRMIDGRIERFIDGQWTGTALGLVDIARQAYLAPLSLPEGMEPGLHVVRSWDPPPMTYSNATHACEVVIDAGTGKTTIDRYVICEDSGTVLNALIVEGQQHGAAAMGIGGALYEHAIYDETGQFVTATLADYRVPTCCEIPRFEIVALNTPNRAGPVGIKGMAEGGVMGAAGAVSLAVNDALMPFGVVAERQPFTPERIRALVRGKVAKV